MYICGLYKKDKNTYYMCVSFIVGKLTVTCYNLVLTTDSHGCQYGPAIITAQISNDSRRNVMFGSLKVQTMISTWSIVCFAKHLVHFCPLKIHHIPGSAIARLG
jgi:hypothetical protein